MAKVVMSISVDERTRQAIEQTAERENISISRAAEDVMLRGLSQGCTPEEVQSIVDGMAQAICEAVKDEVLGLKAGMRSAVEPLERSAAEAQERLMEATREIKLAEKNIGNSAQAALANYALTVWFEKYLLKAVGVTAFESDCAATASYIADNVRIEELYNWFWNIGGALRRNPHPKNFYPAMHQTGQLMKRHDIEELTGIAKDAWERATSRSDSEAIAGLANKDGRSGDKHGRHKQ